MFEIANETWLIIIYFGAVTLLHAVSLKRFIKWSFRTHLWVMGALWFLLIFSILLLLWVLPSGNLNILIRYLGISLTMVGSMVAIWHTWRLGWQRAMGGRFFEPKNFNDWTNQGFYRYLENPIYDGAFLALVGLSLWHQRADFLLIALSSIVFLNLFLARIENQR